MNDTAAAPPRDPAEPLEAWKIEQDGNAWHAFGITEGSVDATVLLNGDGSERVDGRAFMRNGIHICAATGERRQRWLVLELGGVRAYINGRSVLLTTKDLYP